MNIHSIIILKIFFFFICLVCILENTRTLALAFGDSQQQTYSDMKYTNNIE